MPYVDRFLMSDQYIQHVDQFIGGIVDPLIRTRYAGFAAVTAVTVLELAFKDIIVDFAERKHPIFGHHIRMSFERLNGRISLRDIRETHVPKFGDRYLVRFTALMEEAELESLRQGGVSIKSSYGNLITWRNKFVHEGEMPNTATYEEAKRAYECGKVVLDCVAHAMRR